ncbi:MAG: 2-oxoisovalerate dehydrogenase [Actinobacteria bacterium]|nr:2-oxoisovalerate dehydrogenase [Actinomycetota bacterium]
MNAAELLAAYEQMALIRAMEERITELYRDGVIPGFVHTSIGQEAVAVGTLFHTRPDDVITSTHRGHGHVLAKGLEPGRMLAELMGRRDGACRGRGGSMHVADPALGIFGANGIVGAGLPIAAGAAHALKARGAGQVAVAFFGDGAVATGAFHEAVNLAALWRLPVVFLCENNGFSEFSRAADQHPVSLAGRAGGYGLPFRAVPGNDVEATADAMAAVLDQVRSGAGPYLVEAATIRVHGHYEGDPQRYRDQAEFAVAEAQDPLVLARKRLTELGVTAAQIDEADTRATATVAGAEEFARRSPEPEPAELLDYVIKPRPVPRPRPAGSAAGNPAGKPVSVSRVIRQALHDALADDPAVFLAGVDVGGGNVFGLTSGLKDQWPDRVLDTPIAETAIMGLAVGSAMAGLRPVVELMYLDFLGVCLDQILNQAAKLRYMTGGAVTLPLVIRTQFGSGRSSGSQHSQSLEVMLAHIPGLTVVMPSTAADAYGLLRTAIDDDNPVIFIENRLLYERKAPPPGPDHRVPLGQAAITRPGRDLTIVAWSHMTELALAAARELAADGIEAEVIDLRTIVPLDRATVLDSLRRTNRLVIAQEAVTDFGVGAEIAALAVREGFWTLDAPVFRVGAPRSPAPYAPSLERVWRPSVDGIVAAAREAAVDR